MYIIGIGDVTHDVSVALVRAGQVAAVCEYERISRVKHGVNVKNKNYTLEQQSEDFFGAFKDWTHQFRKERIQACIDYCLQQTGIRLSDVEYFVTSSLFTEPVVFEQGCMIEHHLAHAASCFYPSQFQDAAILTVDGCGEISNYQSECTRFSVGHGNSIEKLRFVQCKFDLTEEEKSLGYGHPHMTLNNSLGTFYQNMTLLLGFGYFNEGKTMGLSSYGKKNADFLFIRKHIALLPYGEYTIDNRAIFFELKDRLASAKEKLSDADWFAYMADTAYAHQRILEEILIHISNAFYETTKLKKLCLAGGVALNSVANAAILKNTPFDEVFVQPAAGDNGIAIGCALYGAHVSKQQQRYYVSGRDFLPYLGKEYSVGEQVAQEHPELIEAAPVKDIYTAVAKWLSKGKIVAWYNGRSEIGPRALGNRSILVDPRRKDMKDILNKRVKHREPFRPFAPAIMEEFTADYFEFNQKAPYMLMVVSVNTDKKEMIPAVTHVDNTARLQTVSKNSNLAFYKLIDAFYQETGVPVLLNTSFNVAGEPIVETPEEAIKCFLGTDMDILVLNGQLYFKKSQVNSLDEMLFEEGLVTNS